MDPEITAFLASGACVGAALLVAAGLLLLILTRIWKCHNDAPFIIAIFGGMTGGVFGALLGGYWIYHRFLTVLTG
jgi:hypothetical protein